MTRALVFAFLVAALPPQCEKLLGQKPPATQDAPPPPPPSVPITSATTPPIYTPPDLGTGSATPTATTPPVSAEYTQAKAAAAASPPNWKKVKSLLEKKAKAGKATSDEKELLTSACQALKDKTCLGEIAKGP